MNEEQLHGLDWWKTVLLNSIFYDDRVGKLLNRDVIEVAIDRLIAAATSAERERCAKIADLEAMDVSSMDNFPMRGSSEIAKQIAKRIRTDDNAIQRAGFD